MKICLAPFPPKIPAAWAAGSDSALKVLKSEPQALIWR